MTKWSCSQCGYTLEKDAPPEICPACKQKCAFNNVTCYTPECGGDANLDPRLIDKKKNLEQ